MLRKNNALITNTVPYVQMRKVMTLYHSSGYISGIRAP